MPAPQPNAATPGIATGLRIAFCVFAVGMAFLHTFVSFRGLRSEAGMDHAQLGRELARTGALTTKVVRPYAWAQLEENGVTPDAWAFDETFRPPLPTLLWAAAFKPLERWWDYSPLGESVVYLLDRVIACSGVLFLLWAIFLTHGAARSLFDDKVAAVAAACLVVSAPLWDLAVDGSPLMLVFLEVAMAFRIWVAARVAIEEDESPTGWLLLLGVVSAALVMTQWMAVWLVLGLVASVAFFMPGHRKMASVVGLLPAFALGIWCWRSMQITGDPLGAAKAFFQVLVVGGNVDLLQRDLGMRAPGVQVDFLVRNLGIHWQAQLGQSVALAGTVIPALVGLFSFMHGFRRPEVSDARWMAAVVMLGALIGAGFLGLREDAADDANLYLVMVPMMATLGSAMLLIWWSRFRGSALGFWNQWGFAVLAIGLTALPLIVRLPSQLKVGLTMAGRQFPHWPPYVPDRVEVVGRLVEGKEVVFSDAPWFVAWYADVPAVWVPERRSDFYSLRDKLSANGTPAAGVVVTPVSGRQAYVGDLFTGSYSEWPDLILRGPMLAFDKAFLPDPEFPYKVPLPLVAFPIGERENLGIFMVFYTDKPRLPER